MKKYGIFAKCAAVFLVCCVPGLSGCVSAPKYEVAAFAAPATEEGAASGKRDAAARMIVYNAVIDLEVESTDATAEKIVEVAKNNGGWPVRSGTEYSVIRVKAENLKAAMEAISGLGTVTRRDISGQDITDSYFDSALRLESARKARENYARLMEQGKSVAELLPVEKEIERLDREIEMIEGQQKAAEQQVAYASVTVNLKKKTWPGPLGWIFYGAYYVVRLLFVWDI